ncbi:DivIVA domain-containing protein [Stackebrandtia albiflava]|uniref:DivIVA domain-containing protein n=1 Tax=Stackebrandtia albiflava TaxID=406432 RepID=A0A562VBN0_9ACTN|nr:DivIVA domain-containing protein [Stackebrandtia albiflava]TWJ15221.1 DivIVA domain-containing protein [Stackebrandtia albiflava]
MTWSGRLDSIGTSRRGYQPQQVRELVWRIEQTLSGRIPHAVTAAVVGSSAFDVVRDGYDMAEVDMLLGDAITQLRGQPPSPRQPPPQPSQDLDPYSRIALLRRCWELRGRRFRRVRLGRGYRITEVDDFTDLVAARYGNGMAAKQVDEVQFREQWRGYDESAVDDWLDDLASLLSAEGR